MRTESAGLRNKLSVHCDRVTTEKSKTTSSARDLHRWRRKVRSRETASSTSVKNLGIAIGFSFLQNVRYKAPPDERFQEPATSDMEYGWGAIAREQMGRPRHGKTGCDVTKVEELQILGPRHP